jgi:hypothetical protein
VDKIMQRYQYWSQQADRPSRSLEESALYKPGYGLHERGTHAGHVRARSLYVDATTHPALTALTALGLSGAVLARRRGRLLQRLLGKRLGTPRKVLRGSRDR